MIIRKIIIGYLIVVLGFICCNVNSQNSYSKLEKKLIAKGLVDIQKMDSSLSIDIKYATKDNFMNMVLYKELNHVFLQKEAAIKLVKAQKLLKSIDKNYSLIIFDGLRPRSVQFQMWNKVEGTSKQKYVANPHSGSIHNYGCAVDLSILFNGKLLDMGTDYDYFGKLSQPRYNSYFKNIGKLSKKQVSNRNLLRKIMKQSGFIPINNEWWHFNAFSNHEVKNKYEIIE